MTAPDRGSGSRVQETSDENYAPSTLRALRENRTLPKCNVSCTPAKCGESSGVERALTVTHCEDESAVWPEIDHSRGAMRGLNHLGR
jgi:hypothetical protein